MTKKVQYKSKEQRKDDVRNIIKELNKFELTLRYEPVKKLYAHFKDFIDNGNVVKVNIPFPMINRRIKGNLMPNVKADSVITLVKERFN